MDKGVLLGDCDDLCQHVCQPDRINEVEVVETTKMVIVVKNFGMPLSWRNWAAGEERNNITVMHNCICAREGKGMI